MKNKNIYIIAGTIIGAGLLIWLMYYLRKNKETVDAYTKFFQTMWKQAKP